MGRRNSTAAVHADQAKSGRRTTRQNSRGKSVPVVRPMGRPTALTDRVEETLIGLFIQGVSIEAACHLAGITGTTFHRWMQRGEDARDTLDHTGTLDPREDRFRDFRESVLDARAQAEAYVTQTVFRAIGGGFVTSRRPIVDINGVVQLHPQTGEPLYEESTTPPDGRLGLQYLSRARPKDWSQQAANQNVKVEVSGPDGAPVQIEHTMQQVTNLTERLMQVRQEFEHDERVMEAVNRGEDGGYDVTSMDAEDG